MSNTEFTQPEHLKNLETKGIEIDIAAQKAGVSIATIRNWIKTGYLKKNSDGSIKKQSFNNFIHTIIGKEKLNSRANKSQKDAHDHDQIEQEILNKLSMDHFSDDSIGSKYEESLSDSYRNKEGIYYTPQEIVNDMLNCTMSEIKDKKFCDPSCGSGNFIMRALEIGFKPENVYGFDIDPIAIAITKKRILKRTGLHTENIKQVNFLEYIKNNSIKFDYIYTNPPWGKKIQKKEKEQYASIFGAGKSLDTSSLFFFAGIFCLKENGSLGFLLPESFFNIAIFESARKKAIELKIERLIDYGKPFKGLLTKTQAIILSNKKSNCYMIQCEIGKKEYKRSSDSFSKIPKSILNFNCDNNAAKVIEHVYSLNHITLFNKAKWGLGIVTGNNDKFAKDKTNEGLMPVFKGSDITYEGLKNPHMYIPKDLSLYQQVAPVKLYEAPEKIIYKFISSKLCFYRDTEQRYILNSANMLIPGENFPITCKQLTDLLNSNFMNWLFTNIFNTHKILRSDLESLPIHIDFFKIYDNFNDKEYVEYLGIKAQKNGTYRLY